MTRVAYQYQEVLKKIKNSFKRRRHVLFPNGESLECFGDTADILEQAPDDYKMSYYNFRLAYQSKGKRLM